MAYKKAVQQDLVCLSSHLWEQTFLNTYLS